MRLAIAAVCSAVVLLSTQFCHAVEGGAVTIDTLSFDAFATSDNDASGVSLVSEVSALSPPLHWCVLAGLNFRDLELDDRGSEESWGGLLGARYYITRQTSFDVFGTFDQTDVFGFDDVASIAVGAKQTYNTPRSGVVPYVLGSASLRFKDRTPGQDTQNSDEADLMVSLGAGCDFMLTHTLAMNFQYEYMGISDSSSGGSDYDDASHISVSFKGYWDYMGTYDPRN